MKPSLKAFMKGIIDYAGLFPPADLSLENAVANYETYRQGSDAWMLSRFIIPALRLKELSAYDESLFQKKRPWHFSILGKRTETLSEFVQYLKEAAKAIKQLHIAYPERVTTDIFEIALPREVVLANDRSLVTEACEKVVALFGNSPNLPEGVFFEAYFEENWQKDICNVIEALAEYNDRSEALPFKNAGYKLRCGGIEKRMFPSIDQIAYVIQKAIKQRIAIKATAGLHHPVRHYADEEQIKMHGFFNVFGGAMLSSKHSFSQNQLVEILSDEDAEHFEFTETEFRWRDWALSVEEITQLRNKVMTSFGSCSFDEPREDLEKLGLI